MSAYVGTLDIELFIRLSGQWANGLEMANIKNAHFLSFNIFFAFYVLNWYIDWRYVSQFMPSTPFAD